MIHTHQRKVTRTVCVQKKIQRVGVGRGGRQYWFYHDCLCSALLLMPCTVHSRRVNKQMWDTLRESIPGSIPRDGTRVGLGLDCMHAGPSRPERPHVDDDTLTPNNYVPISPGSQAANGAIFVEIRRLRHAEMTVRSMDFVYGDVEITAN